MDPELGAMRRARRFSAFLLLMGLLTACSSNESEPTPDLTTVQNVQLFFVGESPRSFRLFPEVQTIEVNGDLTKSVMNSLVSGELQPLDPDYRNLWGSGSKLNSITIETGVATIDLALGVLTVVAHRAHAEGDYVEVKVADTGIGIPAEDFPNVFKRFFRASTAKQAAIPGYGIGLSLVQSIVREHHGTITFDSTVGMGTVFTVKLPLRYASTNRVDQTT
jgi:hypothetical protein